MFSATIFNLDNLSYCVSKTTEWKMCYHTHMLLSLCSFTRSMWSAVAFKQRTEAKETKADPAAADSRRYEADTQIRDFILHLARGPCWDLSRHEIVSILHCALSQPSISSLCFHHQEYSAPGGGEESSRVTTFRDVSCPLCHQPPV